MHVIVVGCGRVGSELAMGLERDGHTVAIIDKSKKSFRKLAGFSGQQLVGLGFDRATLIAAGAERAQAFASVTSGDNSNVLSARIAKETFEIPSVVARIYDPRRAQIYQRLGIATVATVAWTTDQIRRRLVPDNAANWTDGSGKVSLIERGLPPAWAGRKLVELADGDRYRVVALSRGGSTQLANPALVGQEGDVLHILVTSDAAADLAHSLTAGPGGH
jgi:trk system potassium uptake protein